MPHLPWSQSHLLQSHFGKVALVSLCPDWKTWYLLAVLETGFPSNFFFQHFGKQSKFLRRKGFSRGKKITSVFGLFVLKPGIPKICNEVSVHFRLINRFNLNFHFVYLNFGPVNMEHFTKFTSFFTFRFKQFNNPTEKRSFFGILYIQINRHTRKNNHHHQFLPEQTLHSNIHWGK